MKALELRASFSITRLKLQSRGERRTRRCSWRDQLYLSVIVCKLKATRYLFLLQLICIVCTRKSKEFNHKQLQRVRTQRSRFKFVKLPFTADFQGRRMRSQTETGEITVRTWPCYIATKPLEKHRIDTYVTTKSEIEESGWGKNGFPLLSQNPFCVDGYIPLLKEDIYEIYLIWGVGM